jgi:hypothetical protein
LYFLPRRPVNEGGPAKYLVTDTLPD